MKQKLFRLFICVLTLCGIFSCARPVEIEVTSVNISQPEAELVEGETLQLRALVLPEGAVDKSITWSSAKPLVASVSQDGLVTALAKGSAVITATSVNGKKASCTVWVSKRIVEVESVTLDKTELALLSGETASLKVTVAPEDAVYEYVLWTSSNRQVATVDNDGVITAIGAGEADIKVRVASKSAFCRVTVTVPEVSLDKTSLTLSAGETAELTATISPSNGTGQVIVWSSSNTGVATVSEDGVVTAISAGTATITATAAGGAQSAACQVTVVVPVSSVSLEMADLTLPVGGTQMLNAIISPSNATNQVCTWSSDNNAVATVTSAGLVSANAAGTAVITVTTADSGKTATCAVTVIIPVSSVTLDMTAITLAPGESHNLTATISPDNATDKTVIWTSSDESVATVAQNGHVEAVGVGTATISAAAGIVAVTCLVTVSIPVESISLDNTSLRLKQGETAQMTATIVPAVATDKTINWSSSDESVATVNQQGVVTAVSGGQAMITATAGSCNAVCVVKVIPLVTSISLSQTEAVLITGQSLTLMADILPAEASGTEISWSSSSASICSVENGVVTAGNATGRATVTASADGVSATCSILVLRDSYAGVYASYSGGSIISYNNVIQSGSQLIYGVTNYSSETITVVSVQLIDGVTGTKGNVMSVGEDIAPGGYKGWNISIRTSIHSPIARFVYTFRGTQYTCEAQYHSFSF